MVLAGAAAALTTCFWLEAVVVLLLEEEELEEELELLFLDSTLTTFRLTLLFSMKKSPLTTSL